MSITAENRDGVFSPLQEVQEPTPSEVYKAFSESELKRHLADLLRLKGSEHSFEFCDDNEDAVYDSL